MPVILTIGHQGGQPGATGNGLVEATEVKKVAEGVLAILRQPAYKDLNWRQSFTDGLHEWDQVSQEYSSGDLGITIHINAGGGTGTETFECTHGTQGEAKKLNDAVVGALGLPNRGIKDGSHFEVSARARNKGARLVLLELFFIDNAGDVARYKERFNQLVEAIARCIVELAGGTWGKQSKTKFQVGDTVLLPNKTIGRVQEVGHDGQNAVANVNGKVLFQWELVGVGDQVKFNGRDGFTVSGLSANKEGSAVVGVTGAVFATEISK